MPELVDLEKQALLYLQRLEKTYHRQIQKALADALLKMRGQMSVIYEKYAINNQLTRAEMTRYNKYQTMEEQILSLLDPAIKENIKTIKKLMPEMYNESFFHYAWTIDNAAQLRLAWGIINPKIVSELFSITNPKNIEMMEALKNYGPNAKRKIRAALLNGLSQGKSYSSMISDLKNAMIKIYSSVETIVRTEGQRAISRGQNDVYLMAQEKGIEGKIIWDATLDGRTRPSHQRMDGIAKNEKGYFEPIHAQYPLDPNLPPEESINCRCRERFEIDGYSPELRRTREQGVIPYMNYEQWKKEFHPDWK